MLEIQDGLENGLALFCCVLSMDLSLDWSMNMKKYSAILRPCLVKMKSGTSTDFDPQEKRRQQMIEIEKQIHETELEQQALAAKASKQHIDLMDKIRVVMKILVFNHTNS